MRSLKCIIVSLLVVMVLSCYGWTFGGGSTTPTPYIGSYTSLAISYYAQNPDLHSPLYALSFIDSFLQYTVVNDDDYKNMISSFMVYCSGDTTVSQKNIVDAWKAAAEDHKALYLVCQHIWFYRS